MNVKVTTRSDLQNFESHVRIFCVKMKITNWLSSGGREIRVRTQDTIAK